MQGRPLAQQGTGLRGRPLAVAVPASVRPAAARRVALRVSAGFLGDLFDYESWAPKSAQAWRYLKDPSAGSSSSAGAAGSIDEAAEDALNERLAGARRVQPASQAAAGASAAPAEEDGWQSGAGALQPSFLASTNEELADALNERIGQLPTSGGGSGEAGGSAEPGGEALTGALLRQLVFEKYGKHYDLSFVRRDLPLGKVLVALNVMWVHAEQRSFPMSPQEFDEKLETIAFYLNTWGQQQRVIDFLREPARPRKGMPRRPIVGCAVSIQLDPSQQVIEEFFSQGFS